MLMLDACATEFLRRKKVQLYIVDSTNTGVVGLNDFRTQNVTLVKGGIHTIYCVKWKMTILF